MVVKEAVLYVWVFIKVLLFQVNVIKWSVNNDNFIGKRTDGYVTCEYNCAISMLLTVYSRVTISQSRSFWRLDIPKLEKILIRHTYTYTRTFTRYINYSSRCSVNYGITVMTIPVRRYNDALSIVFHSTEHFFIPRNTVNCIFV